MLTRVSGFAWHLLHSALPVDLNLNKKVFIVSKCVCCPINPNMESLEHLFVHSELATQLWMRFAGPFQKRSIWGEDVSIRNQVGACHLGISMFRLLGIMESSLSGNF